jgi:hypothetical protein
LAVELSFGLGSALLQGYGAFLGLCSTDLEDSMKKFLALAGSIALVAFAAEEKKPEPKKASCGMACCEKSKAASCQDCPECGKKKAAPKKDAPKTEAPKKD